MLPDWLSGVDLRSLRIADATVSVAFHRASGGVTSFSLIEQQGDVRVTMSA